MQNGQHNMKNLIGRLVLIQGKDHMLQAMFNGVRADVKSVGWSNYDSLLRHIQTTTLALMGSILREQLARYFVPT